MMSLERVFAARRFDQRDALVIQAATNERQHGRLVVDDKNRDVLSLFHEASCRLYQSATLDLVGSAPPLRSRHDRSR
jgi:hypothetical protein